MNENRRYFIDVVIKDLYIPIKIGLKEKTEGQTTIAKLTVQAKIEKKMEVKFEKQVIEIINNRTAYKGPKQLASRLIRYIDTLNAGSININFAFPFFYENFSNGAKDRSLINYQCEYSFIKTALINYKQKLKISLPIITGQYIVPGIPNEMIDIPAVIVVELEGFETFFIEDIIEIVEKQLSRKEYYPLKESPRDVFFTKNSGVTLIENIESDLYKINDIQWCSVKLTNKRIPYTYSVKISGEEKAIGHEQKYAGAYLFI